LVVLVVQQFGIGLMIESSLVCSRLGRYQVN